MEQGADTPMSTEMRAQLIADAIGKVSDGNPRDRVYAAALFHIRNAVAIATSTSQTSLGRDAP